MVRKFARVLLLAYIAMSFVDIFVIPSELYLYIGASSWLYLFIWAIDVSSAAAVILACGWALIEFVLMIIFFCISIKKSARPFFVVMAIDLCLIFAVIMYDVFTKDYTQLSERIIGLISHILYFAIAVQMDREWITTKS